MAQVSELVDLFKLTKLLLLADLPRDSGYLEQ